MNQPVKTKLQTRYTKVFDQLFAQNTCAFIPFVVMGDPDFDTSLNIIDTLVQGGADALELGMPFSDPVADGPTIQNATLRAFNGGMSSQRCFEMLEIIRKRYPDLPIGLLLYSNLVYSQGMETFYAHCAKVGVDSVLVADVPVREYAPFYEAAQKHHIASILICPPDATPEVIQGIARYGDAYTYLVSRSGVTGAEHQAQQLMTDGVLQLQAAGAPPAVQGFGISKPEQIVTLRPSGIRGAISGSAVAELIQKHLNDSQHMLEVIQHYVIDMKSACTKTL